MKNTTDELPEPVIVGVAENGEVVRDMSVLEQEGIAFDPTRAALDLTKAEKRRTTALMMAIQAYDKLIIRDAEMYNAISRDRERNHGPIIQPATMNAMVDAAIQFDAFIAGRFEHLVDEISGEPEPQPEPQTTAEVP